MGKGVVAAKPDDLRLIPETHMVGGENGLLKLSSNFYMCAVA